MDTWLQSFLTQLAGAADITGAINLKVIGGVFILAALSEVYIIMPLLFEGIWLAIGYHSTTNATALLNTAILLAAATAGRQSALFVIYELVTVLTGTRLSQFLLERIQKNRYIRKYMDNEQAYSARTLSLASATLGMLTWLNGPIKFALMIKRRRKVLLLAAFLSGITFDILYLAMGAVFRTAPPPVTYVSALLLAGFTIYILIRIRKAR